MSSSFDAHKRIPSLKMPHRDANCNNKPRKNHKDVPSFSSTLLDEIYRSIDGSDGKPPGGDFDFNFNQEKSLKKIEDCEDFRRACLVENWIMKEENRKVSSKVRPPLLFPEMEAKSFQDNDFLFFSSTSSSSDSSGALSSSDTEFFGPATAKPAKVSCFAARPKPVRTGKNKLKDGSFFDDHSNHEKDRRGEDELIKSKSRGLKIYANLKKMKQPISPGGKLTTFINSLFTNANGKKPKNADSDKVPRDSKSSSKASSSSSSNCSSTSSFSRSCLSKYSPKSREKMREGVPRTVRFHPVSVIVDEDSRPCGHKSTYDDGRPPLPPIALSKSDKNRKLEQASINALKSYYSKSFDENMKKILHEDDDYDDGASDASSDLFELDHLSLFRDSRFSQELPVYETTHFDKNRTLIC